MTEQSDQTTDQATAPNKPGNIWAELGPTLVFVVTYNVIVMTLGVIIQKLVRGERIPPFLILSSVLIGTFGTIGIVLQSKTFLFIKPTIINLLFAGVIFGGLAVGRNIWKMFFESAFQLPDFAWRTLAIRWGLYFVAMAIWNLVLWQFFSEGTWANWRLGNVGLGFVFALANVPYTLKHMIDPDKTEPQA